MATLADPRVGWELLAMASTFAGNLTLLGSVANIIVAEAARDVGGLGFWHYLRVGVPIALSTTLLGTLWVVSELRAILHSFKLPPDHELLPRNAGAVTRGRVVGAAIPYELTFPPGWHRFTSDEPDAQEYDLWAYRPYRDAHFRVQVVAHHDRSDKRLVAEIVAILREDHPDLKVITGADSPPPGRPERTHVVLAHTPDHNTEQWIEVHRTRRRVIILTASTRASKLKEEVLAIMDSFKVSGR